MPHRRFTHEASWDGSVSALKKLLDQFRHAAATERKKGTYFVIKDMVDPDRKSTRGYISPLAICQD